MMKSYPSQGTLQSVPIHKIYIGSDETQFRQKLESLVAIDPSLSGGVNQIVLGRKAFSDSLAEPVGPVFRRGYEEIHEIGPGFCAHITDSFIDQDWRLTVKSRENNLRFRIAFAGEAAYFDRGHRLSDKNLYCSYIVRPAGDLLTASFNGGIQYRYCSLNMTQDYLKDTLGLADDELPPMLLSHWARREVVMGQFPASKASLALAQRFFVIRGAKVWRDVEVRAIAFDLLRHLFENWQNASPRLKPSIRITPDEQDTLTRIRDLIKADPGQKLTIPELCKRFRMSRTKLHTGFKRLCGVSIHEFQTELRMRSALQLLRSGELSIAEIAERSGFNEPTNFTAAFKKHFAALPRQMRDPTD